jgi:hypothetical protein
MIMKSRSRSGLVALATGALLAVSIGVQAQAQAPGSGPPRDGMRMGMGAQLDRAGTLQRFGLDDATLNLTAAQKVQIDNAADAYVAEMNAVNEKYPFTPGSMPGEQGMAARQKVRDAFIAAVNKVLDEEQRRSWEAVQAARRGGMGMGRGGPPGGMGGPGERPGMPASPQPGNQ